MDRPNDIERDAPVIAHHSVSIDAPVATVWALHCDVDAWPSWNQDIDEARLTGPFAVGSSFAWSSHDFPVTSTIFAIDDQKRILWGGPASGIMGVHEWLFDQADGGGTTVTTTESFSGAPVDSAVDAMQGMLDGSLVSWLSEMKREAEYR